MRNPLEPARLFYCLPLALACQTPYVLKANPTMDLESVSDKNLHELEQLSRELLAVMRKSKLLDSPLATMLYSLESQAGELRRARFDAQDSAYNGF